MHQESKAKLGFVLARSWNRGDTQLLITAPKNSYLDEYKPEVHKPVNGGEFVGTNSAEKCGYTTYCQVSVGETVDVILANNQEPLVATGKGGWDFYPFDDYVLRIPPGAGAACIGGFPFDAAVRKTPVRLKKGERFTFTKDEAMPNAYLFTAFGSVMTAAGATIPDFDVAAIKSPSVTLIAPEDCAFGIVESAALPCFMTGNGVESLLR